ncbi:MAG: hypothetical protein JRN24_00675 [Nitrososphaerota archaeon]|nr:hypothetical protein [Nitrososphaerota archaeon]
MPLTESSIIEEIESWRRFADVLRADDRELFKEMIRLCYEYIPAMQARDSPVPSESLFMALLFAQHKTIKWLVKEVEKLKAEERKSAPEPSETWSTARKQTRETP